MKFEVKDLANVWKALNKLAEKDFSLNTAITIADNIKSMKTSIEVLEKKEKELVNKYGEKDEKGELIIGENGSVKIIDIVGFQREHDELFDDEIEIELKPISKDDLAKTTLSANDINALRVIIKELQ